AAGGNIASATGELFDGASDAPGDPPAQEQANEKSGKGHERSGLQNFAAQGDQFFARTAEQEHAEHFAITPGEGHGVKGLGGSGVGGPINGLDDGFRGGLL